MKQRQKTLILTSNFIIPSNLTQHIKLVLTRTLLKEKMLWCQSALLNSIQHSSAQAFVCILSIQCVTLLLSTHFYLTLYILTQFSWLFVMYFTLLSKLPHFQFLLSKTPDLDLKQGKGNTLIAVSSRYK
jgi:hypothetical protein